VIWTSSSIFTPTTRWNTCPPTLIHQPFEGMTACAPNSCWKMEALS
jgi:hypothetical protein